MYKQLKPLKTKKGRDELGLFIVEGKKFVDEIPSNWNIKQYVISKSYAENNDLTDYKKIAPTEIVKDSIFNSLADTVSPQGILAVCEKRSWSLQDILTPNGFILLGENLSDPGNIGALIRTAKAAGANGVIFTEGSGDVFNPKVLRAAAGAVLRIPILQNVELVEIVDKLKKANYTIYAAHLKGDSLPYDHNLTNNTCLMVGNESRGLTENATALANELVRLPMASGTESLNASVAGSVLLYEVVRQRCIKIHCGNEGEK